VRNQKREDEEEGINDVSENSKEHPELFLSGRPDKYNQMWDEPA
jgi:hypothetical protein